MIIPNHNNKSQPKQNQKRFNTSQKKKTNSMTAMVCVSNKQTNKQTSKQKRFLIVFVLFCFVVWIFMVSKQKI